MTANQIAYWKQQEEARHNAAAEDETRRSNLAKEAENYRSNYAKEQETYRHNFVGESQNLFGLENQYAHWVEADKAAFASAGAAYANAAASQRMADVRESELGESIRQFDLNEAYRRDMMDWQAEQNKLGRTESYVSDAVDLVGGILRAAPMFAKFFGSGSNNNNNNNDKGDNSGSGSAATTGPTDYEKYGNWLRDHASDYFTSGSLMPVMPGVGAMPFAW